MAEPRIWVLADDRTGNVVQCLGVAEALGEPFAVKPVVYSVLARLHNGLRGATTLGLTEDCRKGLVPPWPQLVISAGRRTAPVARWLKRTTGARLVQIMDPGWPGREDFDLIGVPRHDRPVRQRNEIATLGSCHRVGARLLAEELAKWQERLPTGDRPRLMLSVGGTTKDCRFTPAHGRLLAADTLALARSMGATVMVTTSRRTGSRLETTISEGIPEPRFFHAWRDGGDNPYLAMLAAAEYVHGSLRHRSAGLYFRATGRGQCQACQAARNTVHSGIRPAFGRRPDTLASPPAQSGSRGCRGNQETRAGLICFTPPWSVAPRRCADSGRTPRRPP